MLSYFKNNKTEEDMYLKIQSNLPIATAQRKHNKWSLQTGSISGCFNEQTLLRETKMWSL